jgi:hypothetical protein
LKGYTVAEAVRRLTGGSLGQDMRVSAIIFHLNKKKVRLFPANARGLLQVVKYLEDDKSERFYPEYCELSHRFRCGDYDALSLISAIKFDWHPIGISTSNRSNICRPNAVYCDAQDWETLKEETWSTFGSRIFLIENLDLHDLKDRYLIEFGEPYVQVIPEIGLADDHQ